MSDDRRSDPPDYGATVRNIRLPEGTGRQPTQYTEPPSTQRPPQPPPKKRGIPIWVWLGAAGALFVMFVAVVLVVYFFLLREPGFTMIVRGAPAGSDVYVDNISRGVTSADGSIRVPGLKAGKKMVRVSHAGYNDFNTSVAGKDGEVRTVIAQLTPIESKPAGLANEIDYNGPMLLIGAGEFVMGSDKHKPDEKPAHKVTLPDFYIDKFEVTNEQFKKFCDETGHEYPSNPWWDDNYFTKPRAPVLGVSWDDAAAYAKWAGKRLPTEQEWEKAASWDPGSQTKRLWPWGDTADKTRANMGGTNRTTEVGKFPSGATPYGVHDMAGNVAEWVDSYYQAYPGNDGPNSEFGTRNRVVRGGTYKGSADDARTTRRLFHTPELAESERANRAFLIGFRCAISADDPRLQEQAGSR